MTGAVAPRFDERQRKLLTKLLRSVGSDNVHEAEAARAAINRLLLQFSKTWSDLVGLLGGVPAGIHPDLVRDLAALGSKDHADARSRIDEWRARYRKSWNDLVDQLCSLTPEPWVGSSLSGDPAPEADLLGLLVGTLKEFVDLEPCEYITVALWMLHSHVFRRFMVTPRLALRSPVAGCGKTVLLDILVRLTARGAKFGSITTAAIYHLIDETHPCLLLDEMDNAGITLQLNGKLRAVLNDGYRYGGTVALRENGETRHLDVFAPVALALPDAMGGLPRTLNSRCITINMRRSQRALKRFDVHHSDGTLDRVYGQILIWLRKAKIDPDPRMPVGTLNRASDNWRVLISVAESLGHGDLARAAMCEMLKQHQDADAKIRLLIDIRTLFHLQRMPVDYAVDRFPSTALLEALHVMDDADWCEFCGARGDEAPHPLRRSEMMSMLGAFGIRTRTIWPNGKRIEGETKSAKGYERSQFEVTWKMYCTPTQTAQASNIRTLRPAGGGTV
jgi:hypothetical protein